MKGKISAGWIIKTVLGGVITLSLPTTLFAQDYLCSATQPSDDALPVLDKQCPVGDGYWSRHAPKQVSEATFWLQCGLLNEPLALAKARPIYQKITTDVWMKPEGAGYRCLIGPYDDFQQASQDLQKVKTLGDYREAFIRIVRPHSPSSEPSQVTPVAKTAQASIKSKATTQSTVQPAAQLAKAAKPKAPPMAKTVNAPKSPKSATSYSSGNAVIGVQIRLQAVFQGRTYAVPYLLDNEHEFYMEHSKPWNRLDYASANLVCRDVDMRLATTQEFNALLGSKVMEQEQWPMHLPYWGDRRTGLFSDGRAVSLKGTSLLNVLCVR